MKIYLDGVARSIRKEINDAITFRNEFGIYIARVGRSIFFLYVRSKNWRAALPHIVCNFAKIDLSTLKKATQKLNGIFASCTTLYFARLQICVGKEY